MRLFRIKNKAKNQCWIAADNEHAVKTLALNAGHARSFNNLIAEDFTEKVPGDLTILSVLTKPTMVALWNNWRKGIAKWATGMTGEYPPTQEDQEQ